MSTLVPLEDQRQGRLLFVDTETGRMAPIVAEKKESTKSASEEGVKFPTAAEFQEKEGQEAITIATFSRKEADSSKDNGSAESNGDLEKKDTDTESDSKTQAIKKEDEEAASKDKDAKEDESDSKPDEKLQDKKDKSTPEKSHLNPTDGKPTLEAGTSSQESPGVLFSSGELDGFATLESVMEELGKEL